MGKIVISTNSSIDGIVRTPTAKRASPAVGVGLTFLTYERAGDA